MSIPMVRKAALAAWAVVLAGLCAGAASAQVGPKSSPEKLSPGSWREGLSLRGPAADAEALFFSADGKALIAIYGSGALKKWDVGTGKELASVKADPDDHKHGKHTIKGPVGVRRLSPDQTLLARGRADGSITLWNVDSGKLEGTLSYHKEPITALAFSPDGKYLVSGSMDNTLRLWDVASKSEKATVEGWTATALAFAPDGKTLLANHTSYRLFTDDEVKTLREMNRKGGDTSKITGKSTRNSIVFASTDYPFYSRINYLDDLLLLEPDTLKERSRATMGHVPYLALWPNAKGTALAVVVRTDKPTAERKLLDLATLKEVRRIDGEPPLNPGSFGVTADGEMIALAGQRVEQFGMIKGIDTKSNVRYKNYGRVVLSEAATGKKLAAVEKGTEAKCTALSPDGKILAASVRLQGAGGPSSVEYRIQLWHDKSRTGDKK